MLDVLQVALRTTNTWNLAPQTTKTFQTGQFCRNMPIIPLLRVIFQLKKNKILFYFTFFFYEKKKKNKKIK
jgi:hypothetical protein